MEFCLTASPEASRLLRVARRDLKMARRLLDPEVEEASWGWATQQCLEKTLKAWLHTLGTKPPPTQDLARLLLLLQELELDVNVGDLLPFRAFTTFAVQTRYEDEPDELGLDRADWSDRAEALIELVQSKLSSQLN